MATAYDLEDWDDYACRNCRARELAEEAKFTRGDNDEQPDLFGLTHRTTWPRRTNSAHHKAEGVFYRRWLQEQRRNRLLHHILSGEDGKWLVPTDRDSIVAASVVQWFGTNVGRGFVSGCEREVGWTNSMLGYSFTDAEPQDVERARALAAPCAGQEGYEATVQRIALELHRNRQRLKAAGYDAVFKATGAAQRRLDRGILLPASEM